MGLAPLYWGAFIVLVLALYYGYLTSMYIVDETYEGDALRELELPEKFTIRVAVSEGGSGGDPGVASRDSLVGKFISKYSLCQCVEEVQIIWNRSGPPPLPTDFVYAHTHSRVSFHTTPEPRSNAGVAPFAQSGLAAAATDAILLLDLHTQLDCADLAFAHSVWRSGKSTLVGVFPRLHRRDPVTMQYSYYGWLHVWWNGVYSILLPRGVFVGKALLQKFGASTQLAGALQRHPECGDVALSVFAAAENGNPPIWVSISVQRLPGAVADESFGPGSDAGGECLATLATALGVERMPYSRSKSARAASYLFWSL